MWWSTLALSVLAVIAAAGLREVMNIIGKSVTFRGEIDGAAVEGYIVAPRVVIEEGAYVRGSVVTQRKVGRQRQASWQQRWPA